jgi:hypothetical protein
LAIKVGRRLLTATTARRAHDVAICSGFQMRAEVQLAHGRAAGNKVLVLAVTVMRTTLREVDALARRMRGRSWW